MKIAILSDCHGNFPKEPLLLDQEIDLLLVVGDIAGGSHHTNAQTKSMSKFIKWVKDIAPKKCLITPGNHDYWNFRELFKYKQDTGLISCLIDSHYDYEGLIVYGSPWSIPFLDWNWMMPEDRLRLYYENIHPDTDILMTHGPALGMCDMPLGLVRGHPRRIHMGSKSLVDELWGRNIRRVFSGHIHSADHENQKLSGSHRTIFNCVSILDEEYKYKYKPLILEM